MRGVWFATGGAVGVLILILSVFLWKHTVVSFPTQRTHSDTSRTTESVISIPSLTLQTLFDDQSQSDLYLADAIRTIVVTGDVIPARSVNYKTITYNNFRWAFEPTASLLQNADITFANLETALLEQCPITNEGMSFCGDKRHIEGLKYAGIDIVNLGNNHVGNFGEQGVAETMRHLDTANIHYVGVHNNPQYLDVRGLRFAFLGYDDIEPNHVSKVDEATIKSDIQNARAHADVVIVQFHWGVEYVTKPTTRQQTLGKQSIDWGADLVIGNHPHWIQPVEIYKGKLITYAHGNFVFDQMWSEKTQIGVVGTYSFYDKALIDVQYTPIKIQDYGQAQIIVDAEARTRVLQDMFRESVTLQQESTQTSALQ